MSDTALRCSVIIPAYNAGATLGRTLAALARQDVAPGSFEVVVVDDGSTDNTADLARSLGARCLQQPNAGPAKARNTGARAAQGEILLFTDADCEPAPDWVRRMLAAFDAPRVAGVQGAYRTRQVQLTARFAQAEFEDRYRLMAAYPSIDLVATYAAGFRRELFLRMGGFDESFPEANNEDTDFSYRLVAAGELLVFAPEALVLHHHPATLRKYLRTKFRRGYWRMIVYKRYPEKAVKDRYTTKVLKFQTLAMLLSLTLLPLAVLLPGLRTPVVYLWGAVLLSALPFAWRVAARDRWLALAAPGFIFLRSVVFALGSACGLLRCLGLKTGAAPGPSTDAPPGAGPRA